MKNLHVIVGLGVTGLSVARFLQTQHIPFAMTDSRREPPQLAAFHALNSSAPLALGALDESLLAQASTIVLSPGVSLAEAAISNAKQRGIAVVSDIELFARVNHKPVIAITGSNAKSTVTTLVGLMMQASGYVPAIGGNLGTPVLELLLTQSHADVFVLELSSFQLETTDTLQAKVATILNVTPDHLDRYETFEAYAQAKRRIYRHCDLAICNRDDPLTEAPIASKLFFTAHPPGPNEFGLVRQNGVYYLAHGETILISTNELPIKGMHYYINAISAISLGYGFGLKMAPMLQVLRDFQGLPHRCQWVCNHRDVAWYNDSKGTNVGATEAAIRGLGEMTPNKLLLIAGGLGKGADFRLLRPSLVQYVKQVILFGKDALLMARAFEGSVAVKMVQSLAEAVQVANALALSGECVLFSPACASYDMFKNFEHRGEQFVQLVQQLQGARE